MRSDSDLRTTLFFLFLTTIYMDQDHRDVDWWTIYPSHEGTTHRRNLARFIDFATKLFRQQFKDNLLERHTPAKKSAFERWAGRDPSFTNQTNTVRLNPVYRRRLPGKHVLVVDDFTTAGYSFECARNLLLIGGARRVTCASFGCYGTRHSIHTPKREGQWDPWNPNTFRSDEFYVDICEGMTAPGVLEDFVRLLEAYS